MDGLSGQGRGNDLDIAADGGRPSSGGSGGDDNGGLRNASSPIIRNAAPELSEALAGAANSLGHGDSVATEPTTNAELFLGISVAVGQSGQRNADSESSSHAVVGLHAVDSAEVEDVQQEHALPVEGDEQRNPGGGENVVVVGVHDAVAPNRRNAVQPEESGAAAVQVEVAGQGQGRGQGHGEGEGEGEWNPRRGGDVVVLSNSSSDDFQEAAEVPVPVGVAGQGESNSGGGGNVAGAENRVDGVQQEEFAVPVGAVDNDCRKRPREEVANQLEIQSSRERNSNEGFDESIVCPICMEPWANSGEHRICSLACGHIFGKSCIKRWLRQGGRKLSRCPHCNKRAKLDEVRTLYVPRTLAVVDGEAQQSAQELRALRAENHRLKLELQEVLQSKERNAVVRASASKSLADNAATSDLIYAAESHNITVGSEPVQNLGNRVTVRPPLFGHFSRQAFDSIVPSGRQECIPTGGRRHDYGQVSEAGPTASSSRAGGMDNCGGFQLQYVVPVHGGKVFDMDPESLTVVFSNKIEGNRYGLSKLSLLSCREIQRIDFPSGLGAIRDIRLSPSGIGGTGKCAVVASAGKKLSLISLDSNNIVLTYSVQSPPWSCAWDPDVPNLLYSGLQNGCLLLVDLRQTSTPLAMLNGPSTRPIHTLQIVQGHSSAGSQPLGGREILSASNSGMVLWNVSYLAAGSEVEKPQCVFPDKELVCISLAYDGSAKTAVASVRRSPLAQTETSSSSSHGSSAGPNSSQPIDVLLNSRPPLGWEEPSHCIFSRGRGSSWSDMDQTMKTAEARQPWERTGTMVGNKSQSLMTRTAIVSKSTPQSTSLFACGDEGTNSVWLWDMNSGRIRDTLVPHQSPILDVKNVQIQGKDTLGCVSEGAFQIYRRA